MADIIDPAWKQSIWSKIEYDRPQDEAFAESVFRSGYKWRDKPIDPPNTPFLERSRRAKNKREIQ